jgi:hypothetical protein
MVFSIDRHKSVAFLTGAVSIFWGIEDGNDRISRIKIATLGGLWAFAHLEFMTEQVPCFLFKNPENSSTSISNIGTEVIWIGAMLFTALHYNEEGAIAAVVVSPLIFHILPKNKIVSPHPKYDMIAISVVTSLAVGSIWNYSGLPKLSPSRQVFQTMFPMIASFAF